jgi:predicted RNA-binding protein with RPS1 domain
MCYLDELNISDNNHQNLAISLGELIQKCFGINSDLKNEIHNLLSKNPYLWKIRPISPKLNYYAGCDVIYLPKIYNLFSKKCEEDSLENKNKLKIENIFKECQKYLKYANINKNIKNYNKMNLPIGTKLEGLIKNFQKFCVFVQLNIGYMGVVYKSSSVKLIKQNYKLGDIINFHIVHVEHSKKKYVLDINEDNIKSEPDTNINYIKKSESKINLFSNKLKLLDNINISEKSFYPKSYLANQNKENNNSITQNNINSNINYRLMHNFSNGWLDNQYLLNQNTHMFYNQ